MKAVERPVEASGGEDYGTLADHYLDSGYLPQEGDQSWRERAALGIAPAYEAEGANDDAAMDFAPQKEVLEPEDAVRGRGGILIALLLAAILVPTIAVLSFPAFLTTAFQGARDRAANSSPPAPNTPPHMLQSSPSFRASLADQPPRDLTQAAPPIPQPQPSSLAEPDRKAAPASNPVTEDKAPPAPARDVAHGKEESGFYAKVMGPDGHLQNRYFPPEPSTPGEQRAAAPADSGGVYAMAPGPDGSLQYRYFPSKLSR